MIDQEPLDPDEQTVTIRPAVPGDDAALEQLATLDGRALGPAPLLVAESGGDGTIVAALSLGDGTVVADPFRYTLEAIALLRERARELGAAKRQPTATARQFVARLSARQATVIGTMVAAILIGASAGQAAPKPALAAGTWVGSGAAAGTSNEGGMRSTFRARLRFTFVVGSDGRVHGTGAFASAMTVTGAISSVIASTAPVAFKGTATDVAYTGTATTRAKFGSATRTLKPIAIRQRLPITRAGACKASGSFVLNGVSFRWNAARKISGTCRT